MFVAALVLAPAAVLLARHVTGPSDGARLEPSAQVWQASGVVVTPLVEQPDGLRAGDVVTAVGGRSLEEWARVLLDPTVARPRWQIGQAVVYTVLRDGRTHHVSVRLGRYPAGAIVRREWAAMLFALVFMLVAGFVFLRRSDAPPARALLVAASGITSATSWSFGLTVRDLVDGIGFWLFTLSTVGAYVLLYAGALHLTMVFPHRWQATARHRWIIPTVYAAPYVGMGIFMAATRIQTPTTLAWIGSLDDAVRVTVLIYVTLIVLGAASNFRAVHRHSPGHRQVRQVALATLLAGGLSLVFAVLPEIVLGEPLLSWNVIALGALLVPVAIAAGILQHQLLGIEVVINRALAYGALTATVVGIYVLVVGYVGALLHARGSLAVSLLAAGLIAVLFQPLREKLQRAVNRWMFGDRDDPYAVLSRLGRRLETAVAPDRVLPLVAETIAQALKLPYAAIAVHQGGRLVTAASYGLPRGDPLSLPLVYQGAPVGQLILSPRAPHEPFTPAERNLLQDVAHQAGVAVHAVRLTAELQRSRERLVTTREEERRRLRRDLHDGLGPALATISLKIDAARNLLARDPAGVARMLQELKVQVQAAIGDIRRVVHDLRPPALDELGLLSAIREQAARFETNGLRVTVEAPARLPALPAAVEVAAYRIVQEALANVARHAGARTCRITITTDGDLEIDVRDDGRGLNGQAGGVGLHSMRERAEELGGTCTVEGERGGGTRVHARLPLPPG